MPLDKSRDDRNQRLDPRADRIGPLGSAAMLGKVTTPDISIAKGKYLSFNPVKISGTESDGQPAIMTVDTATTVVGIMFQGQAATGDIMLLRWVDWRWVTEGRTGACVWSFVVQDECTLKIVPGALVELKQSGTLIKSCVTSGRVATIGLTQPGTNYTSPPNVGLSGGGGSGAGMSLSMEISATARSGTGGSGYTNGNYVGLGKYVGGGGSGGSFTFSVAGGVVQPTMTVVNRGNGYTSTPGHDWSAAGPGTGASAATTLRVKQLVLVNGGNGYTSPPTVSFSGGGGSGAAGVTTVLARCGLTVPPGSYDITVTPPPGYGLDPKTVTMNRSCGTTTILLPTNTNSICGKCGYGDPLDPAGNPCGNLPKTAQLTWTYDANFDAYGANKFPDATLTLGPNFPQYGGSPSYWSDELTGYSKDATGHFTVAFQMKYVISCLGPGVNWIAKNTDGTWGTATNYAGGPGTSIDPTNHSCTPFWVRGGIGESYSPGGPPVESHWRYN